MSDLFSTDLMEPGVWVLATLLVFAVINVVAAAALRPKRRRLLQLAEELVNKPDFNKADRAWLRSEIDHSTNKTTLIVAPAAPIVLIGALAVGIYEGWCSRGSEQFLDLQAQKRKLEDESERAVVAGVRLETGIDPREGRYWNDQRRREISDLAFTIETWNNPIAMLWIGVWLVVAAPALLIGYLVAGSLEPFVRNTWEPFRHLVSGAVASAIQIVDSKSSGTPRPT